MNNRKKKLRNKDKEDENLGKMDKERKEERG